MIPESKRDNNLYPVIRTVFNEYFLYKMEGVIIKEIGKKLRKEAQITFTNFESIDIEEFIIYCDFTIFDKKFQFQFSKTADYGILRMSGGRLNDYSKWFLKKLAENKNNEKTSSFYVNNEGVQSDRFYGIISILVEIISLEFKDTNYYKMSTLYDNNLRDLFE